MVAIFPALNTHLIFVRFEEVAAHTSVALAGIVAVNANIVFETVCVFIVVAVDDVLVIFITLALGIASSVAATACGARWNPKLGTKMVPRKMAL